MYSVPCIFVQFSMHTYSGAYANNVKCMYTRVPVNNADCIGFI